MRVGIDARKLGDTGIGTYLDGLLGELLARGGEDRFVLFLPPERMGAFRCRGVAVEEVEEAAPKYGPRELVSLSHKAARLGLDLFHAPHYVLPLGLPCPSVVTIHDAIHLVRPKSPIHYLDARLVMGHAARAASRVIAVSEHTKRDIVTLLRVDPAKVVVIPNGLVAPAHPAGAAKRGGFSGLDRPYILYVGSLKGHKNVQALARAFATIAPRLPHDVVVCGGESGAGGREGRRLVDLADRLGVAGRLRPIGFVEAEDLERIYAGASLFVFPSLHEGFGFPPLEAMARGIPVVCSNRTSLPEVVGDAAILVDPADLEALARGIERGLGDEGLRRRLVREGVERAGRFRWAEAAEATLAVYRGAAAQGRATPARHE